jgi:hypothetical protein
MKNKKNEKKGKNKRTGRRATTSQGAAEVEARREEHSG